MVYNATIASLSHDSSTNTYTIKVRVPTLHQVEGTSNATPESDLPECTVCGLPGHKPLYFTGDSVYVMFKDNNLDSPVIVGMQQTASNIDKESDINARNFKSSKKSVLPIDTTLNIDEVPKVGGGGGKGTITSKNWRNLYNLTSPVQATLEEHDNRLYQLEAFPCADMLMFLTKLDIKFQTLKMYEVK